MHYEASDCDTGYCECLTRYGIRAKLIPVLEEEGMNRADLLGTCPVCDGRVNLDDDNLDPDDAAFMPDCQLYLVVEHINPGTKLKCTGTGQNPALLEGMPGF